MREAVTWIAIGTVAAAYITQRHLAAKPKEETPSPSAQYELDPTRWRHDGTQPLTYASGNRPLTEFDTERELCMLLF